MIDHWRSYALSDFLLFAPATYFRQFELMNAALMPLPLLLPPLALAVLLLARSRLAWRGRIAGALLCAFWAGSGFLFLWQRYAAINWAAVWLAAGFAVQIALLLWLAVLRDGLAFAPARPGRTYSWRARLGTLILGYAALGWPLHAPLLGRPWLQAEVVGLAPDPTALATLGLLLMAGGRAATALLALPLVWCAISLLTLWTMEAAEFWPLAAASGIALAALIAARFASDAGAGAGEAGATDRRA